MKKPLSKKVKIALFMIASTLGNLLITALCLIVLFFIYLFFVAPILPQEAAGVGGPLVLVAALVLAFIIYRKLVKRFLKDNPFDLPDK